MRRLALLLIAACRSSSGGSVPSDAAVAAVVVPGAARVDRAGAGTDASTSGAPGARSSVDAAPPIVDRPITWTDERDRLMLAYRRLHSDPDAADLTIVPSVIVLHYTAGGSAQATMRYFDRTRLEESREKLRKGGAANVASHFVVDRDGTIYRLMPEDRMGRHCIGLNHLAIGVENVGDDDRWPLTEAQVAANAALIRDLVTRHPTITRVIGHHESLRLEGHPSYVELVPGYRNVKPDPGPAFMAAVRARIADLGLAGAP